MNPPRARSVTAADEHVDAVFAALADGTRRAVLHDLDGGPRSITELAAPHGMSLTGFIKHVRVLEDAGLLVREKEGRTVRCTLTPDPMRNAAAWLAHYEKFWNERLDALCLLYTSDAADE